MNVEIALLMSELRVLLDKLDFESLEAEEKFEELSRAVELLDRILKEDNTNEE